MKFITINRSLILVLISFFARLQAQNYEYFVHVNPFNGKHTIIDSIPGIDWVMFYPSYTAIDQANNVYYFKGADANLNWALIGVDGATGQGVSSRPLADTTRGFTNIGALEHDDSTGVIYAYGWNYAQQLEYLLQVDKVNDSIAPVCVIHGCKSIYPGNSTYDQNHHNFYFLGVDSLGINRMYVINTLSGAVLGSMPFLNSGALQKIQYNNITNKLYAFITSNAKTSLVELDAGTGVVIKTVKAFSGVIGFGMSPNYCTLNENTNEFTFLNGKNLETVNLTTGLTHYNIPFPVGLSAGENVIELKYNNKTGNLFGLHWGKKNAITLGLNVGSPTPPGFYVYPVPAADYVNVQADRGSEKKTVLQLFNEAGNLVRTEIVNESDEFMIDKGDLPAGVYYLSIGNKKGASFKKIVFQ